MECAEFSSAEKHRDVESSPASTKLLITTEPQKIDDLKKLTKREKLLICFIAFLIAILITLAVVIGVLHIKRSKSTSQTKTDQSAFYPCITRDCVLTSSELLSFLDPRIDPCEDFYNYACGGWIKRNPLPKNTLIWNQFTKLEEEANEFVRDVLHNKEIHAEYSKLTSFQKGIAYYKSCVDTTTINRRGAKPLNDLIQEYGSWTISLNDWDQETWSMVKYLALMRRKLSVSPFFSVFVGADPRKSTVNIIQIRPMAVLGLPHSILTANSTVGKKEREAYKGFLLNVTKELGARNDSYKDVMDIISFEIQLAQAMPHGSIAYDDHNLYRKLTIKELNEFTGTKQINWKEYLEQLLFPATGRQITYEQEVVVYGVDYLRNITTLLKETTNRTIANYMMWRVVDSFYLRLGDIFEEISKNFYINLENIWEPLPRHELCINLMKEKYFGIPLGRIYVDKLFSGDSKRYAKELADGIRQAFEQNLQDLDWMDDTTRHVAIEKAKMMSENMGYPDYIQDDKLLDNEYKDVTCNQSTYFENELSLDEALAGKELSVLGKPVDDTKWALSPIEVNAYYDILANKMVFPAAILQSPFYNKRHSWAMLYGGVGAIMGHELTHGFDVNGRRFDMNGDEKDWWSEETLEAFKRRTACLKEQYSNFTLNGGQAYKIWLSKNGQEQRLPGMNLTNEQIFFISFARNWCEVFSSRGKEILLASEHSPGPWRARGSVMNFPEFAKAFNCRPGSPMNPADRCEVW
ncbi:endothelin-converting enzyme 1-like isoform X2 [Montipora capricornis]|uniref:endothelin-converting enzyme 1-like isoform X2 n=1 Tax=Montipora capricornis TaxID=246305 RepID=UPI0035F1CD11